MLEERVDSSTNPAQQFVWGRRYIDDCVLRDRDTTGNGSLDERLYALQDANWNVTSIVNATGVVQERFAYSAYGEPMFLNSIFVEQVTSSHDWERLFAGYWLCSEGWYSVRLRILVVGVGWTTRDKYMSTTVPNLYEYAIGQPLVELDPFGDLPLAVHAALLAWALCMIPHFFYGLKKYKSHEAMRHCVTTCLSARTCGSISALIAAYGFEAVSHTLRLIFIQEGFGDAFDDAWRDTVNNNRGLFCAGFESWAFLGLATRWFRKRCAKCCEQAVCESGLSWVPWEFADKWFD